MYLSRSQIINRDSVVWIDRKKERGEWGREWERGESGMVERSNGEGLQRTGGEIERRWRNEE